jgi:peptide-methionine (S)-S-oxide reductase
MDGILSTRVGYSGGETLYPTYGSMGDHSESIQIDYDPARISYEKLLEIFWQNHDPTYRAWRRQYMSAIFYHNEEQKRLALDTMVCEEKRRTKKILTAILPYGKFYLAEDYHQKYQLRQHRELMADFKSMYPRPIDFINSTAASRVNGYVSGYGTPDGVKANLENLGLSDAGSKLLLEIATKWRAIPETETLYPPDV